MNDDDLTDLWLAEPDLPDYCPADVRCEADFPTQRGLAEQEHAQGELSRA